MGLLGMKPALDQEAPRRFDFREPAWTAGRFILALGTSLVLTPASAMPLPGSEEGSAQKSPLLHPVAVFGSDERKPLGTEHRQLEDKIGLLIDTSSNAVCSAFCASEDIVVTASHCLFRTSGDSAPSLKSFTFRLTAKPEGRPAVIAGAETGTIDLNVRAGSHALKTRPPIGASEDWALLRLDAPACRSGGLPVRALTPDELASFAGYVQGLRRNAAVRMVGAIADDPQRMKMFSNATLQSAILGSRDQDAAVGMMLRNGSLIDVVNLQQDWNVVSTGDVSPILLWHKHTAAVSGVLAAAGLLLLMLLRLVLGFGRRRRR